MKKLLNKTSMLVALLFALIACLVGATTLSLTAHAQEEEPTSTVDFTSFTTIMNVDEEFTFAAEVTEADGSKNTDVEWSSSNEDVIVFQDEGSALAVDEGTSRITATAPDGASAYVDVTVSESAIRVEGIGLNETELTLGVNWQRKLTAYVTPAEATDPNFYWKSSDEDIVTVANDGTITTHAVGSAEISAITYDGAKTATCSVTVKQYEKATLDTTNETLQIGGSVDIHITDPVPADDSTAEYTYEWSAADGTVASPDVVTDEVGTIRAWGFGTTNIYVVVTVTDGETVTEYEGIATVTVTADFFYLTGVHGNWVEYETAADAQAAGVLLTPVEGSANVYSITREFWAYSGFEILHEGIDAEWTTRIDPFWYSADGSTDNYVANTDDNFQVTAYGVYTVTLNLNEGAAKVYINKVDVFVTEVNLSYAAGTEEAPNDAVLNAVGDKAIINIELLPEDANYVESDIEVKVLDSLEEGAAESDLVTYELNGLVLTITAVKMPVDAEDQPTVATLYVQVSVNEHWEEVENATNAISLVLAPEGYVAPDAVKFDSDNYEINVNNGGTPWTVEVHAEGILGEGKTETVIPDVRYSTKDSGISVNESTGLVTASAFGVYTVTATALANPEATVSTTVTVYSSAFYLIGVLEGTAINDWTAILPDATQDLSDTPFADWGLKPVDGSLTQYAGTFNFNADDTFSIVYLGMPGSWYGAIRATELDWENSSRTRLVESDNNVRILETGAYTVTLDIAGATPTFTVKYEGAAYTTPYDLYLYMMRAGDAWDPNVSLVQNVLVAGGEIHVDGETNDQTLTFTYNFADMDAWPTFQFLTSSAGEAGGLSDAYWYGSDAEDVTIDGTAYSKTGEDGYFTNYYGVEEGAHGCQFWYVGATQTTRSVDFTVTFNAYGRITSIVMNWAVAE